MRKEILPDLVLSQRDEPGSKPDVTVYRSLRRDPGTDPRHPFEGERYLLTATLTPQQQGGL